MSGEAFRVTALGCSGEVGAPFVRGLLQQGIAVRVLARDPATVAARHPDAEVVRGNLADAADVARAAADAHAVLLMTPMGLRNDPAPEIAVARPCLEGLRTAGVRHLVYSSVLGADVRRGVGILDAKQAIEALIRESALPHTILRCGTFMEDLFDPRLQALRRGRLLFPVRRDRVFQYTSQRDLPRFIAERLLPNGTGESQTIDFVPPERFMLPDVEAALSRAAGRPVRAVRRFPTFHLFQALLPLFRARGHRFSSVVPLIAHFDAHGYASTGVTVAERHPDFQMTDLATHLDELFT